MATLGTDKKWSLCRGCRYTDVDQIFINQFINNLSLSRLRPGHWWQVVVVQRWSLAHRFDCTCILDILVNVETVYITNAKSLKLNQPRWCWCKAWNVRGRIPKWWLSSEEPTEAGRERISSNESEIFRIGPPDHWLIRTNFYQFRWIGIPNRVRLLRVLLRVLPPLHRWQRVRPV